MGASGVGFGVLWGVVWRLVYTCVVAAVCEIVAAGVLLCRHCRCGHHCGNQGLQFGLDSHCFQFWYVCNKGKAGRLARCKAQFVQCKYTKKTPHTTIVQCDLRLPFCLLCDQSGCPCHCQGTKKPQWLYLFGNASAAFKM